MMSRDSGVGSSSATADAVAHQLGGPYLLLPLLDKVPLVADGSPATTVINCVEYLGKSLHSRAWLPRANKLVLADVDGNLYVGTSASELLHFVRMDPDAADRTSKPLFILASRLAPSFSTQSVAASSQPGVQEIVLLPRVGKACILCNWTVSFFSLPELSPVSGTGHAKNCSWIGGVDVYETNSDSPHGGIDSEVTILLSLKRRIQVVRVGQGARAIKNIDYAGSILSIRRDTIACVADSRSYALLDINRQLKIPLMNISSLDETPEAEQIGQAQDLSAHKPATVARRVSSTFSEPQVTVQQAHGRSASLGSAILGHTRRHEARATDEQDPTPSRSLSPARSASPCPPLNETRPPIMATKDKLLPAPPPQVSAASPQTASAGALDARVDALKPHIVSLGVDEFLVVIGTSLSEPGLGMSVNLDGEVSRAPIEFERYPRQVVVDNISAQQASSQSDTTDFGAGYVLASVTRTLSDGLQCHGLEIQTSDTGSPDEVGKHWLTATGAKAEDPYGICRLTGREKIYLDAIIEKLCKRRFSPFHSHAEATSTSSLKSCDSRTALSIERLSKERELFERDDSQDEDSLPDGWEDKRNSEEEEFALQLAESEVGLAVWAGDCLWWAARNPLLLQVDKVLDGAYSRRSVDKKTVFSVLGSIRNREVKTELDYMTLSYLRQKAALLLLIASLASTATDQMSNGEMGVLEQVLIDSKLDARAVISLVPGVRNEIIEGRRGIWIHGGIRQIAHDYLSHVSFEKAASAEMSQLGTRTHQLLRRFLWSWRKMKGFGSIADEKEVFESVDAALLLVLLEMDQQSPRDSGKGGVRSELNELVDQGVECFDRAVDLLESHHRLFVLSRLYQSRKRAADVLATWKRIVQGERDDGQELRDGEQRVREYLTKVSSQALVEEYGIWLANRNPRLGVEVFADERARVPRLEPGHVVAMLRTKAPNAVKYYLEHLVFGKGQASYVNELVAYYLDVVIGDLEKSQSNRDAMMAAYEAYRALQFPKPTYYHFLEENAPANDEVWHSRLRLLQLLSGPHDYDCQAIRGRISSLPGDFLVPETIILAGREHHGSDALRLLVHRLGDYDTAVAYCLRGGSSVYAVPQSQGRGSSVPQAEQQRRLFQNLLREFLAIGDVTDCMEQTGGLLERFGPWFDIDEVLQLVPDSWPVAVVAGFLLGAMQRLARDKNESIVTRALRGSENLRANYNVVVGIQTNGPSIEAPN
ncbi:hypothetical protein CDD82_7222 [Ophiocordyceps australis]|uniref:CNH domain-containing protein n=1 Tax=Ophiocordyceps australis TaxID=1399860 RepID=A0A2C5YND5_9HYPO|nr:hypothetical protein CDD82_7222 [Ophiocordyceps australis]